MNMIDFAMPPIAAIPIVITPEVHAIAFWQTNDNPFGRPTVTGSVQAFGALMAFNLARSYDPVHQ